MVSQVSVFFGGLEPQASEELGWATSSHCTLTFDRTSLRPHWTQQGVSAHRHCRVPGGGSRQLEGVLGGSRGLQSCPRASAARCLHSAPGRLDWAGQDQGRLDKDRHTNPCSLLPSGTSPVSHRDLGGREQAMARRLWRVWWWPGSAVEEELGAHRHTPGHCLAEGL